MRMVFLRSKSAKGNYFETSDEYGNMMYFTIKEYNDAKRRAMKVFKEQQEKLFQR